MKKSIVISSMILGTLGLMAIGIISKPNYDAKDEIESSTIEETEEVARKIRSSTPPNFSYDIGSRYWATISKEDLSTASSINDIIPKEANWAPYPIQKLDVKLIANGTELIKTSNNLTLTEEQIDLLKTAQYSDDIQLIASYGESMPLPSAINQQQLNYFITVVPEKEAAYTGGKEELINYLKEESALIITTIEGDQIGAGKLMFTINSDGNLTDVKLTETSGYPFIDKHMIDLFDSIPGDWTPAENGDGKKVAQTLMFSFGMIGC
ncbi:energy transducer TonB [Ekhidna sp.]|uniref:energy transducer TonB n=1 Tax=Ekhidna sp. TaxID=2608089 RepID=UPI003CCBAF96